MQINRKKKFNNMYISCIYGKEQKNKLPQMAQVVILNKISN